MCIYTYTHMQKKNEKQGDKIQNIQVSSHLWGREKGTYQGGRRVPSREGGVCS